MPFAFEKLIVYQKAVTFADSACSLTRGFPRGYYFLADQLNRAAVSIAANIAEGNGRFTKLDRKNFFDGCSPLCGLSVLGTRPVDVQKPGPQYCYRGIGVNIRFGIARGSVQECVPLLEIARRRGLVQEPTAPALRERLEVIAKMTSGLINGRDKRPV